MTLSLCCHCPIVPITRCKLGSNPLWLSGFKVQKLTNSLLHWMALSLCCHCPIVPIIGCEQMSRDDLACVVLPCLLLTCLIVPSTCWTDMTVQPSLCAGNTTRGAGSCWRTQSVTSPGRTPTVATRTTRYCDVDSEVTFMALLLHSAFWFLLLFFLVRPILHLVWPQL